MILIYFGQKKTMLIRKNKNQKIRKYKTATFTCNFNLNINNHNNITHKEKEITLTEKNYIFREPQELRKYIMLKHLEK